MDYLIGKLSPEDLEELYMIPVWVVILIAGADNVFSKKEIKKAVGYVRLQKKKSEGFLRDYYQNVSAKFEINLKGYIAILPDDLEKRSDFLVNRLTAVNRLFKKIDMEYASELYLSYRDLAHNVAKAAGGLFGLLSVSFSESRYVDLKMIDDPLGLQPEK